MKEDDRFLIHKVCLAISAQKALRLSFDLINSELVCTRSLEQINEQDTLMRLSVHYNVTEHSIKRANQFQLLGNHLDHLHGKLIRIPRVRGYIEARGQTEAIRAFSTANISIVHTYSLKTK